MKMFFIVLITSLIILFGNVPEYNELNNIIIIDKINIECDKNYNVKIREINLFKDDNGITYKYTYYNNKVDDLNDLKKSNFSKYHKLFYYDKVRYLDTNCSNIDMIKNTLNINPKKIIRSN